MASSLFSKRTASLVSLAIVVSLSVSHCQMPSLIISTARYLITSPNINKLAMPMQSMGAVVWWRFLRHGYIRCRSFTVDRHTRAPICLYHQTLASSLAGSSTDFEYLPQYWLVAWRCVAPCERNRWCKIE